MEKILYINACVRGANSRTAVLANKVLKQYDGDVTEINLEKEKILPLTNDLLLKRDKLLESNNFSDSMFCYANEFAAADRIVIAAPFWDLGFPSLLKIYLEAIMVVGITFKYTDGVPCGLCQAKSLKYVTTSGGMIFNDFGYAYIKSLAKNFFGIADVSCVRVENTDVECMSVDDILEKGTVCDIT